MDNKEAAYAFVAILSFILSIILFFIDGALFWSVGFFLLAVMMLIIRVTWNISGWVERMTRKLGEC